MGELINTLDARNDEDVLYEIISKQITEYVDDVYNGLVSTVFYQNNKIQTLILPLATGIESYACHTCSALVNTDFSSVTSVGIQGLAYCTSLKKLDFHLLTDINMNAFSGNSSMETIILRKNQICILRQTSALNGTPIASGTGYIYVPKALVNSYKTATNWSTYENQFRALEDYTVDGTVTGELDESKI